MNKDSRNEEELLRSAIGRGEAELEVALKDLVRAAETRASLGHYLARYPWHFVVGGLVLGAWLGSRRGPISTRRIV
jgi:hypothetical protein